MDIQNHFVQSTSIKVIIIHSYFVRFPKDQINYLTAGYLSCVADVFFSTGGHFVGVLIWTWLIIGIGRLTPTHSRGTMMGLTAAFCSLGHGTASVVHSTLVYNHLSSFPSSKVSLWSFYLQKTELHWEEYSVALLYAAVVVIAGLLVLFLPSTPEVLPDMISHLAPKTINEWYTRDTLS